VTLVESPNVFDGLNVFREFDFVHRLPFQRGKAKAGIPSLGCVRVVGWVRTSGNDSAAFVSNDQSSHRGALLSGQHANLEAIDRHATILSTIFGVQKDAIRDHGVVRYVWTLHCVAIDHNPIRWLSLCRRSIWKTYVIVIATFAKAPPPVERRVAGRQRESRERVAAAKYE
jgi:hypothetical protein